MRSIILSTFAVVFAMAVCLTGSPAEAAGFVIAGDDAVFGPGSVTIDRAQELEFLDFPFTENRSREDVVSNTGPGLEFEGWRLCEPEELARCSGRTPGARVGPTQLIENKIIGL